MNARLALAILPFVVIAACSDDPEPVVSGGAQFTLQNASAADIGMSGLGACLESSSPQQTVAQRDANGDLKLVVNGADDARVSCSFSATNYSVSVSRTAASFAASGTIKPLAECAAAVSAVYGSAPPANLVGCSLDATVLAQSPSNVYKTRDKKCTIFFTTNTDKRLRGTVRCPLLEHASTLSACSLTPIGDAKTASFFSFANCSN